MGQAKQRGPLEVRVAQSQQRWEQLKSQRQTARHALDDSKADRRHARRSAIPLLAAIFGWH